MKNKNFLKYMWLIAAIVVLLCGCKKQSGDVKRRFSIDEKANYIDGIKDDDIPLIVTDYGPKGVMPIEMTDGDVWMLFSKPMVGLSKLGDVMTESVFRLNPSVKGVFRWYGSRLVSFIPSEPLKPATEYKMILNDGVRSLSGTSFHEEEPKEWTFTTETLALQNMYPKGTNVPPNESRTIVLTFNMPIIASEVVKSLEILSYDKEGDAYLDSLLFTTEIPTKAKYPKYEESLLSRMLVLKLSGDIPRDMDICVILKEGAKPESNAVGSVKRQELSFHTLKPFKYEDYYNGMYEWAENDQKNVTFKFSQPVSAENIEKYVYVTLNGFDAKKNVVVDTPPLAGSDDYDGYYSYSDWYGSYGTCLRLVNLPIEYNSSYTIEIKPGLKDIYGQTLAEPVRQSIEVGDAPMIANIPDGGDRILESDYGTKYAVGLQNVNTGKFAIQKGSDPFYRGYKQSNMADWDAVKTLEKNKFHRMSIDLTPYLNASGKGIINMAWDIGEYEGEDWNINSLNLQVTNLGISVRYSSNKFVILVGQLNTGKPVPNAQINICNKNGKIVSGTTDENGMAIIPFTASHYDMFCNFKNYQDRFILIEATKDDDKLAYKVQPYSHNLWQFGVY
ncbi:MAG: Ig-like domain-containing protein, partial [Spirochaetales bacterium]|nr:Ig-like domain-containing protein [Spirochaetales bacterium]